VLSNSSKPSSPKPASRRAEGGIPMADTDTNVRALRPVTKDRTAAERQRRYRKRRKTSVTAVTAVTPRATRVMAPVTPSAGMDVAAYTAAIVLAGAAAWFSIRVMTVLFPGAPMAVIVMACAMEGAKLVTAGWLVRRWGVTAWIWRLTLVALVAGLTIINATGVYAQLVAAHVGDRCAAASAMKAQDAALAARIEVAAHTVADLDRRLNQVDMAIEEAAKRGRTTTALTALEAQRKTREALAGQRQHEGVTLADLKAERAALGGQGSAD